MYRWLPRETIPSRFRTPLDYDSNRADLSTMASVFFFLFFFLFCFNCTLCALPSSIYSSLFAFTPRYLHIYIYRDITRASLGNFRAASVLVSRACARPMLIICIIFCIPSHAIPLINLIISFNRYFKYSYDISTVIKFLHRPIKSLILSIPVY